MKTLSPDRWPGILTHELAHLRRAISGFPGWGTRSRIDLVVEPDLLARAMSGWTPEPELACDAWVVWALPKDRLTYAEVLLDICSTLSLARPMAPTLSVAGSGRFSSGDDHDLARPNVPCRLSAIGPRGGHCLLVARSHCQVWSAAKLFRSRRARSLRPLPDCPASRRIRCLGSTKTMTVKATKALKASADDEDDDDDAMTTMTPMTMTMTMNDDEDDAAPVRAAAKAAGRNVEAI